MCIASAIMNLNGTLTHRLLVAVLIWTVKPYRPRRHERSNVFKADAEGWRESHSSWAGVVVPHGVFKSGNRSVKGLHVAAGSQQPRLKNICKQNHGNLSMCVWSLWPSVCRCLCSQCGTASFTCCHFSWYYSSQGTTSKSALAGSVRTWWA